MNRVALNPIAQYVSSFMNYSRHKKRAIIKMKPRLFIQYPIKNHLRFGTYHSIFMFQYNYVRRQSNYAIWPRGREPVIASFLF